jgi:GLPGLI family protein
MKKLLLLSVLLFAGFTLSAQNFEGKIVFEISFPEFSDPQMAAMLPKEAVAYFKKSKSRMEMNMMMGMRNVTISDGVAKSSVTLMDIMGQKYAVESKEVNPDQKKMVEEAKVTVAKEQKKIAGYLCTKAVIEMPVSSTSKEITKMEMWFTKDLSFNPDFVGGPMSKIDGSVLEFEIKQSGMNMKLSAKEVVKQPVSDELFVVPTAYKKTTPEELKKAMGGR